MLIPRKEKGQLEIYKCKLGIHDYQEGMLVRDICNKYSIGHTTLNNYLRRLNIVRHR